MDWELWQRRWDAQQEAYLPDREQRFSTMLDVVEAACGHAPRVLDLAGGTGSISRRALARFGAARSVIVDADPALLAIAAGSVAGDPRVRICQADLATSDWIDDVGERGNFDAVLTATALHWLDAERLGDVYREVYGLLRPGGVFANADHMVDDGLGPLNESLAAVMAARTEEARAATGASDWDGWWEELGAEPEMARFVSERHRRFSDTRGTTHTRSDVPSSWHVDALRRAGFAHAGLAWRGLADALVVGVKPPG